jgi:hypothetical protein
MATDRYGNNIGIGDTITKVGSSTEFTVMDITKSIWGNDLLTIDGPFEERDVDPGNVIKK